MSMTVESILAQALELSLEERAGLASSLLASLDPDTSDPVEVERFWAEEVDRRMALLESGEASLVTRDEVSAGLASLRARRSE